MSTPFLRDDPQILHVFVCAAEPSTIFFLFFRQIFGFLYFLGYLGGIPDSQRKKNKKQKTPSLKARQGHILHMILS